MPRRASSAATPRSSAPPETKSGSSQRPLAKNVDRHLRKTSTRAPTCGGCRSFSVPGPGLHEIIGRMHNHAKLSKAFTSALKIRISWLWLPETAALAIKHEPPRASRIRGCTCSFRCEECKEPQQNICLSLQGCSAVWEITMMSKSTNCGDPNMSPRQRPRFCLSSATNALGAVLQAS